MSIFWQVLLALIAFFVVLPVLGRLLGWVALNTFEQVFDFGNSHGERINKFLDTHFNSKRVFIYGLGAIGLFFIGYTVNWIIFG